MTLRIDLTAKFVIYADDSTILLSGPDENSLMLKCNAVMDKLFHWSCSNRLRVNPTKTKAILFRAKNRRVELKHTLKYENHDVELVNDHKILGVTFSCELRWNKHVDSTCKKLSSVAGALARTRRLFPEKVKLNIYNALFSSYINYCSLVWTTTTKENINKLLILQKKAVRHIANLDYYSSTRTFFPRYNIIKANYMYDFRILRSFYFSSLPIKNFLIHSASLQAKARYTSTRNTDNWHQRKFRNNYKLQSLEHNLPLILNRYDFVANFSLKQLKVFFASKE